MNKVRAGLALLALCLPLLLNAQSHFLRNDLLNKAASEYVDRMGDELLAKTGIHLYVITTNEHFPERYNLVAYSKRYEANASKPYVMFIFAPFALITKKSQKRGRVALIPSSEDVRSMYDKSNVLDATIDVIASVDKNKVEDKHAIGVVQGVSEIADEIAAAKGVKLDSTIKETRQGLWVVQAIVFLGAALVMWMFMFKPLYRRIRYGKEN